MFCDVKAIAGGVNIAIHTKLMFKYLDYCGGISKNFFPRIKKTFFDTQGNRGRRKVTLNSTISLMQYPVQYSTTLNCSLLT